MPSESTQLLDTARQGIDQWCHTPVRNGNQIQLLASGVASYEQRWKLIQQAKHSIHIVAFSMMLDQTSIKLRDMLLEKLKQGVEVKLIFDDAVMWSTLSGGIVRDLRRAGAEVIRYHKLFRHLLPHWEKGHPFRQSVQIFKHKLKRRFHEKYLIVDDVPCKQCTFCGGAYFEAKVLKRIEAEFEATHSGRKKAKREVTVPLEGFMELDAA